MYPYYRSHYGSMNALADILGAYTAKKQEQEEANNLASIYEQPEVNTNATVSTPQFGDMSLQTAINNKPNNAMQAAGQSLIPNTFGPQQQNTFTPGGIMDSLQNNYFPKDTQPVQAANNANGQQGYDYNYQAQYDATRNEHPEWFNDNGDYIADGSADTSIGDQTNNVQQTSGYAPGGLMAAANSYLSKSQQAQQPQLHQATAAQPWTDTQNTQQRVLSSFDSAWAKKMKHIAETTPGLLRDKDAMKQITDARMAARNELLGEWKKTETSRNWDNFEKAETPHQKLFFAVKNGLDPKGVQMLMSPEWDSSLVDFGGEKRLLGKNKYTGEMIDMVTKNPITQEDLQNTLTPNQQAEIDYKNSALAARQAGGYGSGGRSYSGGGGGRQAAKGESQNFNSKKTMSQITDMIAKGYSKSYIYTWMMDAGYSQDAFNAYWDNADDYYKSVRGSDADNDYNYLSGDGEPEQEED